MREAVPRNEPAGRRCRLQRAAVDVRAARIGVDACQDQRAGLDVKRNRLIPGADRILDAAAKGRSAACH